MAPPTNRRTGHSKKAQFSAFTGYLMAALGALVGAGLLAFSIWKPNAMASLRAEATDLTVPAGKVGAAARSDSQGVIESVAGYFDAANKNARLKREMEEARVRLAEAKAIEAENARLKALLGLREEEVKPIAFARLIGSSSASTRRFAYLSAGSDDGVKPGMPIARPWASWAAC